VFFLEDLTLLLVWLITLVVSVNMLFLGSVLYRRLTRQRYFLEKDAAAERYRQVVADVVGGALNMDQGAALLGEARSKAERAAAEDALVARQRDDPEMVSRLLFALGYVHRWARVAFGPLRGRQVVEAAAGGAQPQLTGPPRRGMMGRILSMRVFAVPRALAVERLGRLQPALSRAFLVEALRDPAPEVRQLAVAMMGRQRNPEVIPQLLEEMRRALERGNDVSLRTAKTALAAYQLDDLPYFLPALGHASQRMRFCAVDTVREICNQTAARARLNKNDFPREVYEAVLAMTEDEFADVRARAAGVIRQFRDGRARDALRKLLHDESEFVRLHAVRAAGDTFYLDLMPDLAERLTDVRWRVREAAARALAELGVGGKRELYSQFVGTADRYATEQMADEIQRVGAVDDIIAALSSGGEEADLAEAVARKLVLAGKTSLLTSAAISSGVPPEARVAVLEALMGRPDDDLVAVLEFLSSHDTGAVRQKALALIRRLAGMASGSMAVSGISRISPATEQGQS
jgi:HEAT repeat protein